MVEESEPMRQYLQLQLILGCYAISTTLLGFLPSKGISFGTRSLSIKSQKVSALTLPSVVKTSTIPLTSIAQIEENLFPLTNNRVSTAGFPTSNNVIIK